MALLVSRICDCQAEQEPPRSWAVPSLRFPTAGTAPRGAASGAGRPNVCRGRAGARHTAPRARLQRQNFRREKPS